MCVFDAPPPAFWVREASGGHKVPTQIKDKSVYWTRRQDLQIKNKSVYLRHVLPWPPPRGVYTAWCTQCFEVVPRELLCETGRRSHTVQRVRRRQARRAASRGARQGGTAIFGCVRKRSSRVPRTGGVPPKRARVQTSPGDRLPSSDTIRAPPGQEERGGCPLQVLL